MQQQAKDSHCSPDQEQEILRERHLLSSAGFAVAMQLRASVLLAWRRGAAYSGAGLTSHVALRSHVHLWYVADAHPPTHNPH